MYSLELYPDPAILPARPALAYSDDDVDAEETLWF